MSELQVGDKVQYVPHVCHALSRAIDGSYPWAIGRRGRPKMVRQGRNIAPAEEPGEVEELVDKDLHDYLAEIRRSPQQQNMRGALVMLRPLKTWNAVVRAVNDDGTVDLDITDGTHSGVTLHYDKVPVTPLRAFANPHNAHDLRSLAHTCHPATVSENEEDV